MHDNEGEIGSKSATLKSGTVWCLILPLSRIFVKMMMVMLFASVNIAAESCFYANDPCGLQVYVQAGRRKRSFSCKIFLNKLKYLLTILCILTPTVLSWWLCPLLTSPFIPQCIPIYLSQGSTKSQKVHQQIMLVMAMVMMKMVMIRDGQIRQKSPKSEWLIFMHGRRGENGGGHSCGNGIFSFLYRGYHPRYRHHSNLEASLLL